MSLYPNPKSAYCGYTTVPANSIYASIPIAFFDPPEYADCSVAKKIGAELFD